MHPKQFKELLQFKELFWCKQKQVTLFRGYVASLNAPALTAAAGTELAGTIL